MGTTIEFGSKSAADTIREQHEDHLCPDDDKRKKTVRFQSGVPDHVIEDAERQAFDERGRRDARSGQAELTDTERDQIDFSKGNANVPWAQSIKAIARSEGVDDWTAYVDPTLTVDEHRGIMEDAATEGGGRRLDAEETAEQRAGRAARSAASSECDHAKGHCANGDPDACEFLTERCGFDREEVDAFLNDTDDPEEITGEARGALGRAWNGYKGAINSLASLTEEVATEWSDAQQAARAINQIREAHGQDPLHLKRLEEIQADLLDLTREMAADCHECHADHSDHPHDVDTGEREDVRQAVVDGQGETPVGVSEETADRATTDTNG